MTPILIITRPAPQGAAFAADIREAFDGRVQIIQSPLLRIVPVPVSADLSDLRGVIFTSANGVAQAHRLGVPQGIRAYCVGDRTATAAAKAGFDPVTGPGDAVQLVQMILSSRHELPLAHIRGQHARSDVATRLTKSGVPCGDIIAYDQQTQHLTVTAKNALNGDKPVVVPLFSPRTCTIFSGSGPFRAPIHIVAISDAALPVSLPVDTKITAVAPDGTAMVDATLDCLRSLTTPSGQADPLEGQGHAG